MNEQKEVFIFASPEIQALLADSQVDLLELLRQEGLQVDRAFSQDPTKDTGSAYKEPTTIILASAFLAVALTPVIIKVIEALSHKSVVVRETVRVAVEDSNGNVVRNSRGEPILQWVERARLLESTKLPQEERLISAKGPFGYEISYQSSSASANS